MRTLVELSTLLRTVKLSTGANKTVTNDPDRLLTLDDVDRESFAPGTGVPEVPNRYISTEF